MASSFGGTIKLQGESEYKKALADITGNLKVLNSEMKVVTSQYDKNDKSAESLGAQNEVLNKKIEEQKNKVELLSKALADAETETGENSSTTKKWQIELNNAQAELNKLVKTSSDNTKAMEESADATEDFGDKAKDSGQKALSLGDIIKANLISEAVIGGVKALASGIASVGSSMTEALTNGASYADNILTLSTQTGIASDKLQKYQAISELTDVSLDTVTGSMAKMTKSLETNADTYKNLGVSIYDANGQLRDSEDIFNETLGALGEMENATERDALAMSLFGKSAQDLNPLIALGTEELNNLGDQAVKMGAVLSDDAMASLGALDDEMQIFASTTSATGNILASAFAPAVSSLLGGVNDLGAGFNYLISSIVNGDEGGITEASAMMSESISSMVDNIAEQLPKMMEIAQSLISTLLNVLTENLPKIIQGGMEILTSLLNGITSALPQILPVMVQAIMTISQGLIQNLPTILQAGITILVELVKGIAQS